MFHLYHHILNPVNEVVLSPPPISQHQGVEGPILHHHGEAMGGGARRWAPGGRRSRLHLHEVKVRDGEGVERTPKLSH